MRELYDAELLELMEPDYGTGAPWPQQLAEPFLMMIGADSAPPPTARFVRLHVGKISNFLLQELAERGLARHEGGGEWWQVEERTADLYMAYLASEMSAVDSGIFPVTDSPAAIGTLNQQGLSDNRSTTQRLAALRYAVIEQTLPAPQGPVPAAELRRFKDDNAERLQRCRTYLDGKLADLATIDDPALREVKQSALVQEIEDDVSLLQEQMARRLWPKITLVGIGGVMGAALSMGDQLSDAANPLAYGLAVGTGLINLGAPGYGLYELLKQPRLDPRAPLAYAALASQL